MIHNSAVWEIKVGFFWWGWPWKQKLRTHLEQPPLCQVHLSSWAFLPQWPHIERKSWSEPTNQLCTFNLHTLMNVPGKLNSHIRGKIEEMTQKHCIAPAFLSYSWNKAMCDCAVISSTDGLWKKYFEKNELYKLNSVLQFYPLLFLAFLWIHWLMLVSQEKNMCCYKGVLFKLRALTVDMKTHLANILVLCRIQISIHI